MIEMSKCTHYIFCIFHVNDNMLYNELYTHLLVLKLLLRVHDLMLKKQTNGAHTKNIKEPATQRQELGPVSLYDVTS